MVNILGDGRFLPEFNAGLIFIRLPANFLAFARLHNVSYHCLAKTIY